MVDIPQLLVTKSGYSAVESVLVNYLDEFVTVIEVGTRNE